MRAEISIVPFKHKYLQLIIDLHNSQNYMGIEQISMKNLPKIGYIALLGTQPVACGFLRRVEGGFAQIDTLASNAHYGSQIRHEGVKQVVDSLVNESKRLKLRGIISLTKDISTIGRAKALGFHVVDQTVIALPLKELI